MPHCLPVPSLDSGDTAWPLGCTAPALRGAGSAYDLASGRTTGRLG